MKHLVEIRNITLAGLAAGLIYSLLTDDLSKPAPILNGIVIGLLGGFLAGIFEIIVFHPKKSRPAFLKTILLKVVSYFVLLSLLIALVKARIDSLYMPMTFSEYIGSQAYQQFIYEGEFKTILTYAFFTIIVIIFTKQTGRYLGRGVLFNLLTGKYHRPKEEERIFLLIDICGSTSIAEKMDPVSYFRLLDRFFFDVSEGIRPYHGFIYRYVGDQVTIAWKMRDEYRNADCIRAFFAVKQRLHQYRELYLNTFGFIPDFRGTAHIGKVFAVEIGDIKTQIVYQGVALYEVNKFEKTEYRINNGLSISEDLRSVLQVQNICTMTPAGETKIAEDRTLKVLEVSES